MLLLKAVGAGLAILASLVVFTVGYSAIRLYVSNLGAARSSKAVGLALIVSDPLYWMLATILIAGEAWLLMRSRS